MERGLTVTAIARVRIVSGLGQIGLMSTYEHPFCGQKYLGVYSYLPCQRVPQDCPALDAAPQLIIPDNRQPHDRLTAASLLEKNSHTSAGSVRIQGLHTSVDCDGLRPTNTRFASSWAWCTYAANVPPAVVEPGRFAWLPSRTCRSKVLLGHGCLKNLLVEMVSVCVEA